MDGSRPNRTDDFQNFCGSSWIGFNFYGSGLDSDWKISQSAHLWCTTGSLPCNICCLPLAALCVTWENMRNYGHWTLFRIP